MLDDMFPFIDLTTAPHDLFDFIAQVEGLFETPEQFKDEVSGDLQGNPYELYLLLQRLKGGSMNFDDFITQASEWAKRPFAEHIDRV